MWLYWTDRCFLLVMLCSVTLIIISLRKRHTRLACQRLFSKPLAVSSGIILLFFLIIALSDSIHIGSVIKDGTVLNSSDDTILDRLVAPLGRVQEKTYSAPFALTAYSFELQINNGILTQVYPRLTYVPITIKNRADQKEIIISELSQALVMSVLVTMCCWIFIIAWKWWVCRELHLLAHPVATSALITIALALFVVFASYSLSRYFHIFGTGKIGQDLFYYTIKSIHTGLIIGILTTIFMFPIALFFGVAAGFWGGLADDCIQYIYTTVSSIPGVLLVTAAVLSLQTYMANHPEQFVTLAQAADVRLFALCMILGVTSWATLCRLLRAETLKLREMEYITAARALGSSVFTIMRKHIIPNLMHIVLITIVLDFSFLVLAEAVLSYVGAGVSPLTMSWGNMINGARLELAREPVVWWPIMAAFIFMFILVLASNIFADAVRDAFDPKQAY